VEALIVAARHAADKAYAPYSRFSVGAAVLAPSGRVYAGCNVENASYGLSICAQRNAAFQAIAAGERAIVAVVVYTPTAVATAPCRARRARSSANSDSTRGCSACAMVLSASRLPWMRFFQRASVRTVSAPPREHDGRRLHRNQYRRLHRPHGRRH
jgi:cytidine deaminase